MVDKPRKSFWMKAAHMIEFSVKANFEEQFAWLSSTSQRFFYMKACMMESSLPILLDEKLAQLSFESATIFFKQNQKQSYLIFETLTFHEFC